MRDQLLTSMSSKDTSAHIDERLDALLVELKSKTDTMNASVVDVKETLVNSITQIRQQSESDSQSFFAAIEKVSTKSESTSTADFAALHAVSHFLAWAGLYPNLHLARREANYRHLNYGISPIKGSVCWCIRYKEPD